MTERTGKTISMLMSFWNENLGMEIGARAHAGFRLVVFCAV